MERIEIKCVKYNNMVELNKEGEVIVPQELGAPREKLEVFSCLHRLSEC